MIDGVCPKHKTALQLELVQTGGCTCHPSTDEGCYCDSPDVHAELHCNTRGCNHRITIVPGLTDVHGIERWIAERWQP